MSGDASTTSLTLLGRLRRNPTDQAAWSAFVKRYGRKIYAWSRQWGLQDADAQDMTQMVLLKLARHLREFQYRASGSFRSWLKTVAHHAWCDFLAGRKRLPGNGTDLAKLDITAAGEGLLQALEEECDREMLEEAMVQVRLRVQPHTWQAFVLTTMDNLSGAEAAARLGIKPGTVFVARSKVKKMLEEEVRRLEQVHDEACPGIGP